MRFEEVVLKPIISEKSLALAKVNQYTFRTPLHLGKRLISKVVEKTFNVKVGKVSLACIRGKRKKTRGGRIIEFPDWKKAVVTLQSGKIDVFEKN